MLKTTSGRLTLSLAWVFVGRVHAQLLPAFDVTSVKVNTQDLRQRRVEGPACSNGRFVALGQALQSTILWAYNITKYYQIVGMPQLALGGRGGASGGIFDIEGKTSSVSEDQCRLMVRKLLVDRFRMTSHVEIRDFPVYELVVGKNGPKMKQAAESDTADGVHITLNGSPARLDGAKPQGLSMQQLVQFLSGPFLDHPVVDKTGLEGLYKVSLDFAWLPRGALPGDGASADLFTAVQQQLGLKLEATKESMETLVIDHLEQPDAN